MIVRFKNTYVYFDLINNWFSKPIPFTSTGVGKCTHYNRRGEVLLTDDLQSSAPQSPSGTGDGLGPGIGDWTGRLNCTPG